MVFGEGRRPEAATQVRLEAFEGPLGLLLSLIEARHLDVLTVPLGALAEAYLDALAGLEVDRIGNVSGFVAIAGQLILIKSRAMLPRPAEPAAAVDRRGTRPRGRPARPAHRLPRPPRRRRGAPGRRPRRGSGCSDASRRPRLAAGRAGAVAEPAPPLDPARLVDGRRAMLRVVPPPPPPPETMPRTITIADRAELIRAALRGADRIVLQELLGGVRDRVVVVVTFLALLELMKRREIVVEQAEPWGPIVARSTTAAERAAAGVAVSPDEPIDESLESFA